MSPGLASRRVATSSCQGNPRNFLPSLNPLSCKKPREGGKFYLNVYFSEGAEDHDPSNGRDFKFFKMTYLNPYENEAKKHLKGEVIAEEDEDEVFFDAKFKEALRIK